MNRNWVYLGIIIVLLVAGYFMLRADKRLQAPSPSVVESPSFEDRTFSWRFSTVQQPEGDLPPRTDVALISNGKAYNFGSFPGSCSEIAPENLLPNEVAGVLCWWAGAGDEIGIFAENQTYIVRRGFQEEGGGESEGFRGSFNDIVVLE